GSHAHESKQSSAIARGHDATGARGEHHRNDDYKDDLSVPHGGCGSSNALRQGALSTPSAVSVAWSRPAPAGDRRGCQPLSSPPSCGRPVCGLACLLNAHFGGEVLVWMLGRLPYRATVLPGSSTSPAPTAPQT